MQLAFVLGIVINSLSAHLIKHNFWNDICKQTEITEKNYGLNLSIFFERNFRMAGEPNLYNQKDLADNYKKHMEEIKVYQEKLQKFHNDYLVNHDDLDNIRKTFLLSRLMFLLKQLQSLITVNDDKFAEVHKKFGYNHPQ